jgi:hypothetical protein
MSMAIGASEHDEDQAEDQKAAAREQFSDESELQSETREHVSVPNDTWETLARTYLGGSHDVPRLQRHNPGLIAPYVGAVVKIPPLVPAFARFVREAAVKRNASGRELSEQEVAEARQAHRDALKREAEQRESQ